MPTLDAPRRYRQEEEHAMPMASSGFNVTLVWAATLLLMWRQGRRHMSVTLEPLHSAWRAFPPGAVAAWSRESSAWRSADAATGSCFFSDQPPPSLNPASPPTSPSIWWPRPPFPLFQRSYALALTAPEDRTAEAERRPAGFSRPLRHPHAVSANLARQILQAPTTAAPKVVTTLHGTNSDQGGQRRARVPPITRFAVMASDAGAAVLLHAGWPKQPHAQLGPADSLPIDVIANFMDNAQFQLAGYPGTPNAGPQESRAFEGGAGKGDREATADREPQAASCWAPPAGGEERKRCSPPVLAHVSNFRALKQVETWSSHLRRPCADFRPPGRRRHGGRKGRSARAVEAMSARAGGLARPVDFQSRGPHGECRPLLWRGRCVPAAPASRRARPRPRSRPWPALCR